jgi:hypothetical protein
LLHSRDASERITDGNEESIEATKIEGLKCNVEQVNGKIFKVDLQEIKFLLELLVNLFSMNKALKNVFEIRNEDIIIHLRVQLHCLLTEF